VRVLLVSDLHYELPKYDWILERADEFDLLVVAGDLLDISSVVPLDVQIGVVLEYLDRFARKVPTVACSGNHDLDDRGAEGEKYTAWIAEARRVGVVVDGDTTTVGDWLITSCAWWEGPTTLARLEGVLVAAAAERDGNWMWVYHSPPDGPLSTTGKRSVGDPELPRLLKRFRPDLVLCGHVHEAPFVADGGWIEQRDGAWLFNSGQLRGAEPAHIVVDLDRGDAAWWSYEGSGEVRFGAGASS
jgi:predicted MPP superfamily phosphohydrolase